MANLISGIRIVLSAALLFCPPFSRMFYGLYLAAGLSDVLDGAVARRTNTVSSFGATLDSIADLILVVVCMVRLLPALALPLWLYGWIGLIVLIKCINIVSGYVMQKKFVALHTTMNKVTGFLLFVLPLTATFLALTVSAAVVCAVATFAAVQEGHLIRTGMTTREGGK
jgi:CDP-diacylglycerol--glycerol-3-phosphate 3-phosphatidyltransferase